MTRTARRLSTGLVAVAALSWPIAAAADPIGIVEDFFSEARIAGAKTADHGPIDYDPGSGLVTVPDIVISWPVSLPFGKGGATFDIDIEAPSVEIRNLREVEDGFRMDAWHYADGTRMSFRFGVGDKLAHATSTLTGADAEDLFWPYMPSVQVDSNRPVSSYFPYLRWVSRFEYGRSVAAKLTVTQQQPDMAPQVTTYEDIESSGMKDGRIAYARIGRMVSVTTLPRPTSAQPHDTPGFDLEPPKEMRIETGAITYRGQNLKTPIDLLDPENYLFGETDPDLKTVLDESTVADTVVTVGDDVTFRISRQAFYGIKMRQPAESPFAFFDRAVRGEEPNEEEAAAFGFAVLGSIGIDRMSIDDIRLNAPGQVSGGVERIALRGLTPDGLEEFAVERAELDAGAQGRMAMKKSYLEGLVFPRAAAIQHLVAIGDKGNPPARAILDVIPMLSTAGIEDFSLDGPDGMSVSLERYKTEMRDHIAPIPTDWREQIVNFVLPVAAFRDEPQTQELLRSMGLDHIRSNGDFRLRWDEASKDLIVGPIILDMDGIASVRIDATIGGVPRFVFEDPEKAQAAMATLSVSAIRFELQNERMVQTALANFAEEQGISPVEARDRIIAELGQKLAMLQNPAFSEEVIAAATDFLNDPRTLTVVAKPDQPVPASQILGMAAMAPGALVKLLGVGVSTGN
ncbi:hypothetical protein GGD81_001214 [Rhodobium orientis]|uniref:Uncharacterized protein n=1 Tax=Rhodobium orientis TaxID=34017 RepID=A0A327JQE1_9HYPH|nr:hypothetical protein [Rhodobium orientis]MBB4302187.1 hypothetical protein [Rhodobium orientis]MBK5948898.1 hypothetical protein [Rhodobium orientis]RAI27915.1 hypothetical protein CH339_08405 [Rhodobium orientis]